MSLAQIETDALAITWSCEKFQTTFLGKRSCTIETDHKPVVSLLSSKQLDSLCTEIFRFCLHMDRFAYDIHHVVSGKNLNTGDILSRAHSTSTVDDQDLEEQAKCLYLLT